MWSERVMIIFWIAAEIAMILLYKKGCFPEPCSHSKSKIKFELDLFNNVTKSHLRGGTDIDTSKFAKKAD